MVSIQRPLGYEPNTLSAPKCWSKVSRQPHFNNLRLPQNSTFNVPHAPTCTDIMSYAFPILYHTHTSSHFIIRTCQHLQQRRCSRVCAAVHSSDYHCCEKAGEYAMPPLKHAKHVCAAYSASNELQCGQTRPMVLMHCSLNIVS